MDDPTPTASHVAVVLAGGRGSRLGGASKPDLVVAGQRLLDHVLRATAHAARTVVVGPPELVGTPTPTLLSTREHPAYGGPVAGLAAGLATLEHAETSGPDADVVLVLACDVPLAARAVPALLGEIAAEPGVDGVQLVDDGGRRQPLVAAYRRSALRAALDRLERGSGVRNASMRRLTDGMTLHSVPDPAGHGIDVDTWADLRRWELRMSAEAGASGDPVPPALSRWVRALAAELGIDPAVVDVDTVLKLAGEAAHAVVRPAAPVTTYAVGYAVGYAAGHAAARRTGRRTDQPADPPAADRSLAAVAEQAAALARDWPSDDAR